MSILKTIDDKLVICEAATPGPWVKWKDHLAVYAGPAKSNTTGFIEGYRQEICQLEEYEPNQKANAILIADAGTNYAKVLRALKVAVEALNSSVCDCYIHEQKHRPDCEERRNSEALSTIEKELNG